MSLSHQKRTYSFRLSVVFVVSPRLGVVRPPVVSGVTPGGPVGRSPLGQDGPQDEAFPHCDGAQGNTHSYGAQEDGLGQGLEDGQADDGEEEDVLHGCSLGVLETRTGSLAFYNPGKSRSDAGQ